MILFLTITMMFSLESENSIKLSTSETSSALIKRDVFDDIKKFILNAVGKGVMEKAEVNIVKIQAKLRDILNEKFNEIAQEVGNYIRVKIAKIYMLDVVPLEKKNKNRRFNK